MSEYAVRLKWSLGSNEFAPQAYNPDHQITFSGGLMATMTSAPDYGGNPKFVNPEEAIASALSSCHMMTFLALAAKANWQVDAYQDRAVARLGQTDDGKTTVSSIILHPFVKFKVGHEMPKEKLEDMHERAHRYCFVANALKCEMGVQVQMEAVG